MPPREATNTERLAWILYDWANSAHSTLLITVVLFYVQQVVVPGRAGLAAYAWSIAAAMLIAAVLSPIVGAMADANGSKRRWLAVTALGGAGSAIVLALLPSSAAPAALAALVGMCLGFDLSLVPYNGFLKELAGPRSMNRLSAWGFAAGYLGGSIPLVLAGLIVRHGPALGLATAEGQCRASIALAGVWWAVFSLPAILVLRDRTPAAAAHRTGAVAAARQAIGEVAGTLRQMRRYPAAAIFLLAYFFYNDGIQTVINQANTLAQRDLHFGLLELIQFILVVQLVALPGSLAVGWLADRVGDKPTLLGCLVVWVLLLAAAVFVQSKAQFWAMGVALALVLGGPQSVSRALMGRLAPAARSAEFFGFFNLSGKAASFPGPLLFGLVGVLTGNARLAAASLLVMFALGAWLLWKVDVAAGRQQAAEG